MSRADRISGVFWLCFAILVMTLSYRLGLGKLHQPGPGFLFFWVNFVLAVMAIIVLIKGYIEKKKEVGKQVIFGEKHLAKILSVLGALFLYGVLMEFLGYIVATLLLLVFLFSVIEKKSWYYTAVVTILVIGISYWLFEIWLQTLLPRGVLSGLLVYLKL
jgi:putative tricarboxylic transport membrane protein